MAYRNIILARFELSYRDSRNASHFSIFPMQTFPPSPKIMIRGIIQFLFPKQTNFFSAAVKNNFNIHVSSLKELIIAAACTLKLRVINPSYLKKLWRCFYETDPPVNAIKWRLHLLLIVLLIVHCIGNFLSVRPENQHRRQLQVKFYSRSYISQQDQVGYRSGEGIINFILWLISYGFN